MSQPCCPTDPPSSAHGRCPAGCQAGSPVRWTTVAALVRGRVPTRQAFRLCREPECAVVYYGAAGAVLTVQDLTVQPGFKEGSHGLVCYCFLYRKSDIARQLEETGRSDVFEAIEREVQAGNCACEVRNPSGKCCLGEVRQAIQTLESEMEVTA